jgi:hypothetical protein
LSAQNSGQTKLDCVWKNQECSLTIDLERGFILTDANSGKDLWTHPYNTLSASNDDGAKLLWLQFRGSPQEDEFVLQVNPKVVVFTIHNFLSAKLQLLGKAV